MLHHCELGLSALKIVQHAAHYIQAPFWLWQHCSRCDIFAKVLADSVTRQVVQYVSLICFTSAACDTRMCTLVPSNCVVYNASVGYRLIGCEREQLDFEPMAYQAPADSIHAVQRPRLL